MWLKIFKKSCLYFYNSGQIPFTDRTIQKRKIAHDQAFKIFKPLNGDNFQCLEGEKPVFWIRNQLSNSSKQANTNQCFFMSGYNITTWYCNVGSPCGICKIPSKELLYLKGLCKHNMDAMYDFVYYVDGLVNNRPHFK